MCPDPSSLTFEVEVADEDVTRAASSVDAPWPARLSSVNGKADDLQLSCRVLDGIVRPDADSVAVTRGSLVSSLSSFGVSAAVYPAASTYSAQPCGSLFFAQQVTAGAPTGWFWPGSGKKAAFYAYYPYGSSCFTLSSTAASVGVPVYSYTVPASVASQPDIMTAQVTDVAGDTGGSVALPFRHRCAALRFSLANEGSDDMVIDSVIVERVASSGTLQGDTWTPGASTGKFYLAPASGITVAAGTTEDLTGSSGIFFMVPQTIPAGAKLRIVTSEDSFEAELSGSWLAGKTYGYEITKVAADYIDLGLPSGTLWARGNIGKDSSGNYYLCKDYETGTYFSWANIVGYNIDESYTYTKTQYINNTPGGACQQDIPCDNTTYDAARARLGSPWHMPSKVYFKELYDNTEQELVTDYKNKGINGYKFMKKTDHSVYVFFPLAGKGSAANMPVINSSNNDYWSSSYYDAENAYYLRLDADGTINPQGALGLTRNIILPIRPVIDGPNYHEGHEFINLGLPSGTLWATMNIGASAPEEYGPYFSWGNTIGYAPGSGHNFSSATYNAKTDGKGVELTGNIPTTSVYDAAVKYWGGSWRMPTDAEWQEVINNCTAAWQDNYNGTGVSGNLYTSNRTGYTDKSMFVPAGGRINDGSYTAFRGIYCSYWSSTYYNTDDSRDFDATNSGAQWLGADHKYRGMNIRAVLTGQ